MQAPLLRSVSLALSLSVLTTSYFAYADASSSGAAQALFDEGKKLTEKKDYAAACPKFAASQKLDPGAGTLLHLGDCYEKQGKFASAWATYVDAAAAARAKNRNDWADNAKARAERIEPKVPKLVFVVQRGVPGLELSRDGALVDVAAAGTPLPIDPGVHALEARAKGYKSWSKSVTLKEGATERVDVPALEAEPVVAAEPTMPTPPPASSAKPETVKTGGGLRTAGYVTAGIGIVGLAAGGVTGLLAMQNNNKSKDLCPSERCANQEGVDAASQAKSLGNVSTIAFVAGGGLTALGLVFIAVGGPKEEVRAGALRHVYIAPSFSGLGGMLGGQF
jgi:hypothetical protein